MIDEKKIEKAATECADEYYSLDYGKDREETNREIFTKGVQWALKESKKSLWHDAKKELPEDGKHCLVRGLFEGGGFNREGRYEKVNYIEYFVSFHEDKNEGNRFYTWDWNNIPIGSCLDHSSNELEDITHWCYLEDIIEKLEDLE